MPLMIKLNRNVVRVYLCLDNGHFITGYIFFIFQALLYLKIVSMLKYEHGGDIHG